VAGAGAGAAAADGTYWPPTDSSEQLELSEE